MSKWSLKLHKFTHWEYWSVYTIYLPLSPVWLWLSLRARTLFFFNGANTSIQYGGMAMEHKNEIYDIIPDTYIPITLFFSSTASVTQIITQCSKNHISFPMVIKPNIGLKGLGVAIIHSESELVSYWQNSDYDVVIQEFVSYKNEVGIFYHRLPNQSKGKITGIVQKEFLTVKGNGIDTLKELIVSNPRSYFQIRYLSEQLKERMNEVISKDEELVLVPFGSHTRGAKFIDISHLNTLPLQTCIDKISKEVEGFYYGRLDIMYDHWEDLCAGKGFSIIEINGAKSEPTHMYDPKHSIFFAWSEIIKHWKIMCDISVLNYKKGHSKLSFKKGIRILKENRQIEKQLREVSNV